MPAWILAGLLATVGADAATTDVAFARYPTRTHEQTAMLQSAPALTVTLALEGAAAFYVDHRLRPQHPKLATGVSLALMAAHGSAAAWNLRQLARAR